MMDRIVYESSAIFFLAATSLAQPFLQKENFRITSWILDSSEDSVSVSFAYAIPYNRLIFTKSQNNSEASPSPETFEAELSFSIDATDSATGINYHRSRRDMIAAKGFSVTQDSKCSAKEIITMTLPKSVYKFSAEVRDDNQQISYLTQTDTRRLAYLSNMPSVIFADSSTRGTIYPDFASDVAPFPRPITFVILTPDSCAKTISLKLETISGLVLKSDSISPQKATLAVVDTNGILSFQVLPSPNHLLYEERFESDSLTEGNYNIEADFNGKTERIGFNYLWVDKPFTLRNLDTALSLLKYLVPDSVYAYLNSGSEKERKEKFDGFWKSHDPTPKTAYNEHEAKYYQRADYAVEQFRTISADDGSATDRGKAYILFGKPGNIRREFRSDGTYEIWSYPNQKKNLFFKEEGPGNFILYRTEDL